MQLKEPIRVLFLVGSLIICSQANATDVFIRGTGEELGHGHLRVANGECYAITPKHLVETPGKITVVRFGGDQSAATVEVRDSSDVAILHVLKHSICDGVSNPRLEGVSSLLENETSGQLQMVDENGDRTRVEVELTTVGRKQIDIESKSLLVKGISGSTLVVRGKPVDMVIRSEGKKAYAYPMAFIQSVWDTFKGGTPTCDDGCEVNLAKLSTITRKEETDSSTQGLLRRKVDSVYQFPENWPTPPFFHVVQEEVTIDVAGFHQNQGLKVTAFAFSDSSTPFAQDLLISAIGFEVAGETLGTLIKNYQVWSIRITGSSNLADVVVSIKPVKGGP